MQRPWFQRNQPLELRGSEWAHHRSFDFCSASLSFWRTRVEEKIQSSVFKGEERSPGEALPSPSQARRVQRGDGTDRQKGGSWAGGTADPARSNWSGWDASARHSFSYACVDHGKVTLLSV
uniref:Uncharacterized protein n=1 Tax=Molossus molossus TaxID=27622 RepID=A0A7J8IZ64_MOLMO|nr:hypothetical protein HJG59_010256 [Molossus molossus]